MTLRITPDVSISQAIQRIQQSNARLSDLRGQISSGLRITRPSDDPTQLGRLLESKATDARVDIDLENIEFARARLNQGVTHLQAAGDLLTRAQTVVRDSVNADDRELMARQVDQLIEEMLRTANAGDGDQHFFGGTEFLREPYVVERDGRGAPLAVQYVGSPERSRIAITPSTFVDTLYVGSEIFETTARGETLFIGDTGAAPGVGVNSATGTGSIQVRHSAIAFDPGSGVQSGTGAASGNNLIGPAGAHILTINDTSGNGSAGTIQLNGGPTISFTNADTNLRIDGAVGERIYINTTNITAGFNGSVAITADGTISTDGGLTSVPIDYSDRQAVQDSRDGTITYVDSRQIRRSGTESVEYERSGDIFQTLIQLRDDLRNTRAFSESEWQQTMQLRLGDLQGIQLRVHQVLGEQSVTLEHLDALEDRSRNLQLDMRTVSQSIESADVMAVALQLQNEQNALRYTLATVSTIYEPSLLDFIS